MVTAIETECQSLLSVRYNAEPIDNIHTSE